MSRNLAGSAQPSPADGPDDPVHTRIAHIAQAASYEISARDGAAVETCTALIERGTGISITWMPQDTDDDRVDMARRLSDAGYMPVPHIAARMIGCEAQLERLVGRLCDEAGVTSMLVISGDVKTVSGPFPDSATLIASPGLGHARLRSIWIGGYPEGHPGVDNATLTATIDAKIAAIQDRGIQAGVISQFCFDAAPILQWGKAFRARHADVPMRIGLAGPASIRTLFRFARICGVGTSAKALVSRGASIARLLTDAAPDPILRDLADTADYDMLQPMGVHFFPFGGLERTARWANAVAAGRFDLRRSESGFQTRIDNG
ncbi:MAG: methylenetetrahydrofolate reductase [Blastomonas sp.]